MGTDQFGDPILIHPCKPFGHMNKSTVGISWIILGDRIATPGFDIAYSQEALRSMNEFTRPVPWVVNRDSKACARSGALYHHLSGLGSATFATTFNVAALRIAHNRLYQINLSLIQFIVLAVLENVSIKPGFAVFPDHILDPPTATIVAIVQVVRRMLSTVEFTGYFAFRFVYEVMR